MATKGSLSVLGIEEQTNAGPNVQSGGTIDSGTTQAVPQRGTLTEFKSEEVNVEQSETVTPTTEKVNDEQKATPGVLGTGSYYAETSPLTSSWENKAEQQSGIKFQQDVLAGKQTMLRSAQEAQAKGQEMQTQLALGEYMRGQSTEKAG
jgi:CCR4-NOT transcriptional regulation complex NOT5 subunit